MQRKSISTLSQYLNVIEVLRKYYPTRPLYENPTTLHFIYRGICDQTYGLLPGVFRKHTGTLRGEDIINKAYAWAEERDILTAFIHEASSVLSIPPDNIVRWAEYAQHYGVPTRFLDWTSNPLTALYFSCRDKTNCDGTVWLLHAVNYELFLGEQLHLPEMTFGEVFADILNQKSDLAFPIVYKPFYVDARMSAQNSYLMIWGTKEDALEHLFKDKCYYLKYPQNNTPRVYCGEQQRAILFNFHIPATRKQHLLHELDMVGINEKTLFPGLDGIGRYVERTYKFDFQEAHDLLTQ